MTAAAPPARAGKRRRRLRRRSFPAALRAATHQEKQVFE